MHDNYKTVKVTAFWCAMSNLELLGFVVLQSFHNWSKSLFIVPFCSNCHGS